jgi:hypothetical protein
MSEIQTPAMTVLEDINRLTETRGERHKRLGNIRKAVRDILQDKLVEEDIYALYRVDPEGAIARYKEMRVEARSEAEARFPKPDNSLSVEDRKIIARARFLKGTARNWERTGEDKYFNKLAETADEVRTHIERDENVINWLRGCIPSIAEYTGEPGKTSFNDKDIVVEKYASGGTGSYKKSDSYRSLVGGFNSFIQKFENKVEGYKEQLAMYENDPIGEIVDGIEGLGLVRIYEDVNDGCLWFEDTETGQEYYYNLYRQAPTKYMSGPHVMHEYIPRHTIFEKYSNDGNWHVDLAWYALSGSGRTFRTPESIAGDYFGSWDSLRSWIAKSVKDGNEAPDHFPNRLTTAKK